MPRKVQPRWGQTTETNQADFEKCLNRMDQRLVLELLGVSDSHDNTHHFYAVSEIMREFHGSYFEPYIPTNAEVRATFDELKKSAKNFEHDFFELDWLSKENLSRRMERMISEQSSERAAQDYQKFYDMLFSEPYLGRAMLSFLFEAIRTIKIKEYPARKGRPGNYPVKTLIIHLSRYYEMCTGQKAAKGVTPDPITGEFDLPPEAPSFIPRVCGFGFHILRRQFGQARRARSPQIAQALDARQQVFHSQEMNAA